MTGLSSKASSLRWKGETHCMRARCSKYYMHWVLFVCRVFLVGWVAVSVLGFFCHFVCLFQRVAFGWFGLFTFTYRHMKLLPHFLLSGIKLCWMLSVIKLREETPLSQSLTTDSLSSWTRMASLTREVQSVLLGEQWLISLCWQTEQHLRLPSRVVNST